MNIDWSNAPERASHYCTTCSDGTPWRDYSDPDSGWYQRDGVWKYQGPSAAILGRAALGVFVPRPVAQPAVWNGECPPPVGTECEFRTTQGRVQSEFEKVRVQYLSEYTFVGLRLDPENGVETEVICHPATAKFRPIRTAEQIAAEERDKAVNFMMTDGGVDDKEWSRMFCAALYDAGYRKQVAE